MTVEGRVRVLEGGVPLRGESVTVSDRGATVLCADFRTHVFGGEVSVRYRDGTLDLVALESVERPPAGRRTQPAGGAETGEDRKIGGRYDVARWVWRK